MNIRKSGKGKDRCHWFEVDSSDLERREFVCCGGPRHGQSVELSAVLWVRGAWDNCTATFKDGSSYIVRGDKLVVKV